MSSKKKNGVGVGPEKVDMPENADKPVKDDKAEKVEKPRQSAVIPGVIKKGVRTVKEALTIKRAPKKTGHNAVKENRLELMFTIVDRGKAEFYHDLLQDFDVNMQVILLGRGTADASMLALFGFSDNEKAVIVSVIKAGKVPEAFALLENKFKTIKNGKGIAYTVPMSGIIGKLLYGFLSDSREVVDGKEQEQ